MTTLNQDVRSLDRHLILGPPEYKQECCSFYCDVLFGPNLGAKTFSVVLTTTPLILIFILLE